MNRYKIEHNGQVFTVEAATPDEALSFVTSQSAAPAAPTAEQPVNTGDWGAVGQRLDAAAFRPVDEGAGPVTADQMRANRQKEAARQGEMYGKAQGGGSTFGRTATNSIALGLPNLLEAYTPAVLGGPSIPGAEAHEFIKGADRGRSEANPYSSLAGTVAGIAGQIATMPVTGGPTVASRLLGSAALGAGMGAAEGAIESRGDVGATAKGGAVGGLFGLGGGVVGEGITRGVQAFRRTPEENALRVLNSAARDGKLTPDAMAGRLNQLGPDAVLADAMGEPGRGLVKTTASLSPEARDTFGRLIDRQAGQNSRVVSAIDEATGFRGQSADAIKTAEIEKFMPQVAKAYDEARAAGMSIDPRAFDDIYNRPMGQKARARAQEFLENTKPLNPDVNAPPAINDRFDPEAVIRGSFNRMREPVPNAPMPESLSEYVAKAGGIRDWRGEAATLGLTGQRATRNSGAIVTKDGRSIDDMTRSAAAQGYFNHLYGNVDEATSKATPNDLLQLLQQDLTPKGGRVLSGADDASAYVARDAAKSNNDRLKFELGDFRSSIDRGTTPDILAEAVRLRASGKVADPEEALRAAGYADFIENGAKPREVPRGMFLPDGVAPPPKVKMEAVSPLEIADLTKRGLDDMAKSALAKEDGLGAAAGSKLAAELRARADELVSNYPTARAARQGLYQREESMDLASKLAGRSALTADDIAKAEAARGFYADPMAKTYGASLAERLNNTRSTPGALTPLDTEFSSQGMRAALGDKADTVLKQLEREREFARTARALGGSDTADKWNGRARLLAETGVLGGAGYMYGGTETGLAGLALAGARRGMKTLAANTQERRIREAAPLIAQALMSREALRQAPSTAKKFAEAKVDPRIPLIAALLGSNLAIQAGGTQ